MNKNNKFDDVYNFLVYSPLKIRTDLLLSVLKEEIEAAIIVTSDFDYIKDWIGVNYEMPLSSISVFSSRISAKDFVKESNKDKKIRIAFKVREGDHHPTKIIGLKAINFD
jgi:hypothetical protein